MDIKIQVLAMLSRTVLRLENPDWTLYIMNELPDMSLGVWSVWLDLRPTLT